MVSVRGDERGRAHAGFICPKAFGLKQLHEDPDRLRTPLIRRDGELRRGDLGRGVRGDRPPPDAAARRARPQRGRRLHRQPQRAQPVLAALRARLAARARLAEHLLGLDRRPDAQAGELRADVRAPCCRCRCPDVDRTDHLLILGANPLVSNGSLLTAPDMRGRLRAHPRARRQGRGDRPAPHAHRRGGRRAPLHPPRRRRPAARRDGLHAASRRTWPTPAAGRARRRARAGARRSCATSRPSAWRAPAASRPSEIRRHGARAGGAPSAPPCTPASAPARRSSARSPAGWSTCSTC